MSRFIFITDIHFNNRAPIHRIDNYFETQLKKIEWVLEKATEMNAKIIFGGDLFEKPCPPDFVGYKVAELLERFEIDIYAILGNHDCISGDVTHSLLGMFEWHKYFHFLDYQNPKIFDDCTLFGYNYDRENECSDFIGYEHYAKNNGKNICVIHNMITEESSIVVNGKNRTRNWQEVNTCADLILCGHFHPGIGIKQNSLGAIFINPGAMVRQDATEIEINRKPKVAFINIDNEIKVKLMTIPYEQNVFDIKKLNYQKDWNEEKSRFVGALEDIKDEDIMSGNVMNILDNLTKEKLPKELQSFLTEKIVDRCKKKILEISQNG